MLRKALGEENGERKFIETVPRRGYKFIADVREVLEDVPALVVEKQTVAKLMIDEEFGLSNLSLAKLAPRFLNTPRRTLVATLGSVVAVAIAIGAFVYSSKSDPARATAAGVKSIAVLPFKHINSNELNDHQGLGLADVLITRLSNIKEIKVRPTSAVASFEESTESSTSIGQRLLVDAVLEGSLLRVNDRLRVTARLLRVGDQAPIWAGQFEKAVKDELQLQDEIAFQLVDALALKLTDHEEKALTKRYTQNAEAYQLYLKGRYHWNKRKYESLSESERLFRNAIEKDPNFALAYVGLADSLLFYSPTTEMTAALAKAMELDPNLAEAWASFGFHQAIHLWKWTDAEQSFRKAIELNPGFATAHHWDGILLSIQGRHEEAKAELKRALEIDPLSYNFLADLGQAYYFNHEYANAEEQCKKALAIYPEFPFAHQYLSSIYLQTGMYETAIEETLNSTHYLSQNAQDTPAVRTSREKDFEQYKRPFREGGITKYFRARIEEANTNSASRSSPNRFYGAAFYYALLGEKENALDQLERGLDSRNFYLAWVKAEPVFDVLRGEPRFKAILQKMGLPPDS